MSRRPPEAFEIVKSGKTVVVASIDRRKGDDATFRRSLQGRQWSLNS